MDFPVLHRAEQKLAARPDWLPDAGVYKYVWDMMKDDFGVDVDALPAHWIPLTIVGTLDWIVVCGWWIFRNTGIFESDEPYKFVFEYDGYEFDPDQLLVFKEDNDRHKFAERLESPGITGIERTEALPFIAMDIFEAWVQDQYDMNEEEAEQFIPPIQFLELAMYCVFIWILDEYGREWIYMQDELIACVYDYKVAYLAKWDETMLDPNIMQCTHRPLNSCRYCNTILWCVAGAEIDTMWQFICNNCLMEMANENIGHLNKRDMRIKDPHCPHWAKEDGTGGNCTSTCPHSGITSEKVWEKLEERGSQRVANYRDHMKGLGGRTPRQVAGQTLSDIVDHFRGREIEDRE